MIVSYNDLSFFNIFDNGFWIIFFWMMTFHNIVYLF